MVFNVRKMILFYAYLLFVFILCVISFNLSGDTYLSLKNLGIICVIELIGFSYVNAKMNGRFLNFSTIFIIVLFVFNFGQLMINTFFTHIYSHVRFLLLLSPEDALYGFKWINLSFNVICLGICFIGTLIDRVSRDDARYRNLDYTKIAKKIILFTFPVKIGIDLLCVYISITSGGEAARLWLNESPNVLLYYGKISLVGFGLLIISLKEFPKKQMRVFVFAESYILIMMLSGIRSENVGYVVVLLLVYLLSKKKKTSLLLSLFYCLVGVVVLAFIITVGEFRTISNKSFGSFIEIFDRALTEKNVILSLFDTCGDTGYTALCVITKWLPQYNPSYGASYGGGIFAILPNIPKVFTLPGNITEATCFALKLQEYGTLSKDYTNIGGSLIGELFFNFGLKGGVFFSSIVGVLIGVINKKFLFALKENSFELIWTLPFMFATIYWVRSYFGGGIREAVWGWLVAFLFLRYTKKQKGIKGITN